MDTGRLPELLAGLEAVRVEAVLAAAKPPAVPVKAREPDRVLTVEETATALGRSVWWIYRHEAELPMVRFPSGRYGFSERRLQAWIEGRTRGK